MKRTPWRHSELAEVWRHPDMSAEELAERLPGRTSNAIRIARSRYGRWRADVVPLCQKCGQHPADTGDPWAARRQLCAACALAEKEWRDEHAMEMKRRNDARRQRKSKALRASKPNDGTDAGTVAKEGKTGA